MNRNLIAEKEYLNSDLVYYKKSQIKNLKDIYKNNNPWFVVLGNHDIHFLAVAEGLRKPYKEDTLNELLESEKQNLKFRRSLYVVKKIINVCFLQLNYVVITLQ